MGLIYEHEEPIGPLPIKQVTALGLDTPRYVRLCRRFDDSYFRQRVLVQVGLSLEDESFTHGAWLSSADARELGQALITLANEVEGD